MYKQANAAPHKVEGTTENLHPPVLGTPSNLFDRSLRLSPAAMRALQLAPGARLTLAYDQNKRTLSFVRRMPKPGKRTGDALF
ncbi:hypothetical protein [Cohnella thermotolerans]|uniref:hypothetical protein n=1 Tax=Cohnella thermotolerans TaxID=329858 RepID=UPI00041C4C55|nr:hypothetical protein [Cohnella thermotolerans]